ncbi:MAG: hypothetical protein ABL996_22670, partial [Micropepsaceae bacterium]
MNFSVPGLVRAAGGEIFGKVRLQKIVYLLDQIGLKSGFSYEYHHYGPYSEQLAERVEDEIVFGRLKADLRRRQSDGVPYVVFRLPPDDNANAIDRDQPSDRIRMALSEMSGRSATVLELAATINWL